MLFCSFVSFCPQTHRNLTLSSRIMLRNPLSSTTIHVTTTLRDRNLYGGCVQRCSSSSVVLQMPLAVLGAKILSYVIHVIRFKTKQWANQVECNVMEMWCFRRPHILNSFHRRNGSGYFLVAIRALTMLVCASSLPQENKRLPLFSYRRSDYTINLHWRWFHE